MDLNGSIHSFKRHLKIIFFHLITNYLMNCSVSDLVSFSLCFFCIWSGHTSCNVPFVYPTLLSHRGQGSSAALHMVEYTDGRSLYQAAGNRAYHGVIAIGHW